MIQVIKILNSVKKLISKIYTKKDLIKKDDEKLMITVEKFSNVAFSNCGLKNQNSLNEEGNLCSEPMDTQGKAYRLLILF